MSLTRLSIIRVAVVLIIISANFAVGWYLFNRYVQINDERIIYKEEINNPRINKGLINKVIENFEERKVYKKNEEIENEQDNIDPFYN